MHGTETCRSPRLYVSAVTATALSANQGVVMSGVISEFETLNADDARRITLARLALVRKLAFLPDFATHARLGGRAGSLTEGRKARRRTGGGDESEREHGNYESGAVGPQGIRENVISEGGHVTWCKGEGVWKGGLVRDYEVVNGVGQKPETQLMAAMCRG